MSLVAVIMAMLLFGTFGTTVAYLTANNLSSTTEELQASQAFYVAEGGMQYVLQHELNGDPNFSNNVSPTGVPFNNPSISLNPGQFWVEYLNQQTSNMSVRVTSRVGNTVRIVQQGVAQGGNGYSYVTVAGGNMTMNSSSGDVFGDVALGGNANFDDDVIVHGNVQANSSVTLPTVDFSTYSSMTTQTFSGNYTFSSNFTGDVRVTGNCTINANVTYTGLLYCDGNVDINGNNVIINGSIVSGGNVRGDGRTGLQFNAQTVSAQQHMPAILNSGNLSLKNSDGMRVTGVMWNSGNIDLSNSDNLDYTGSFMAGGNVLMNSANNARVTFDADLTTGIPGMSGGSGAQTGSLSLSGWKPY